MVYFSHLHNFRNLDFRDFRQKSFITLMTEKKLSENPIEVMVPRVMIHFGTFVLLASTICYFYFKILKGN